MSTTTCSRAAITEPSWRGGNGVAGVVTTVSYDPNKTYLPSGAIIRQFAHAFVVGIGSMLALIILMIQAIWRP